MKNIRFLPKLVLILGALIALSVNALLTYFVAPLAAARAVDGAEVVLLAATALLLSVYSYVVGRLVTPRLRIAKLVLWLVGILGSEFVALWLIGTPRTLPTAHVTTLAIWLFTSLFIFAWCLLGQFVQKYRDGYRKTRPTLAE